MKIQRLCLVLSAFSAAAFSPAPCLASGYEFDGISARAMARGGAMIAAAADWSAIYWNPANLADVKGREAGLELKAGSSHSYDGNSFSLKDANFPNDAFGKKNRDSSFIFGSMGAAVPLDGDSAIGAGFYMPLLQGSEFKDAGLPGNTQYTSIDYKSFASIMVANVSYARKVSRKASLALGVNAIRGNVSSDAKIGVNFLAPGVLHKEVEGTGYGLEGIFGGKYQFTDSFAAGAVIRTGAKVKIEGEAEASLLGTVQKSDFEFNLRQPATSGVGAAWKYRRDLTFTCDLTQTWWKGFTNRMTYDTPATMLPQQPNSFHWKNSYKFRAGALWNYGENTDLMAGYAYDTPAIDAGSIDHSTAIDVHMHRFSAAASRRWSGLEATLGVLAGNFSTRKTGGVKYGLGGGYVMGELKYKF